MSICIYPEEFLEQCEFSKADKQHFPNQSSIKLQKFGDHGEGVLALKGFKRGDIIGRFTGLIGSEIKQHTLQIDPHNHIYDPHFIGFLLHSCDPNCVLDMHQRTVYCIKDIEKNSPLTMDYASTEDTLFLQFPCLCQSKNCRLWITGRNEKVSSQGQEYLKKHS